MSLLKTLLSLAGQIGLALIAIAIPVAALSLGIIPALEAVTGLDASWISLIRRLCMILAFIGGYWVFVRFAESRPVSELQLHPGLIGLYAIAGAVWIGVPMLGLYLTGDYLVTDSSFQTAAFGVALVIFAAALLEEIIFRAILFCLTEKYLGFWTALLAPSLLFAVLHFFNENWGGWISLLSGSLLGIMWTLVYARTRNIWAAAVNHAVWNFTIFSTGLPLTGQQEWRVLAPLQSGIAGPDWITGGAAGPENSALVIVFVTFIVLALLVATLKRRASPA